MMKLNIQLFGGRGASSSFSKNGGSNKTLGLAKEVAKELFGKNLTGERLTKEAKKLIEFNEGEVIENKEDIIKDKNGNLVRSSKYFEKWLARLKKNK